MTKYIFITGGVVSGLGKGITGSSLGLLLKKSGLKVFMQKLDPYLNVDPGTMSPYQHGEVYVTRDGAETDLDLGHYERFIDVDLNKNSVVTSGKIYQQVLENERNGNYDGKTVQVIPHITDSIKIFINKAGENDDYDVVITEIGGTVGDIESQPYIETIRQIRIDKGQENVMFIHVALLPYLKVTKEYKTKPIQHSVKRMLELGIQPDVIVARAEGPIDDEIKNKIALFCNIKKECVISCQDAPSIYEVPLILKEEKLHEVVRKQLKLNFVDTDVSELKSFLNKVKNSVKEVEVSIVGKYVELSDAYLSVIESLRFAGYEFYSKIKINWIQSANLTESNYKNILKNSKGILVPGGFGPRGFEGKILAAKYARENNIPYLGLCLGMQVACIEIARNVMNKKDANSTEFNSESSYKVFDIIEGKDKENIGGTLRLGEYPITIVPNTLCEKLYKKLLVKERHRHRYEFNNILKKDFEKIGLVFSGNYVEKDLVEVIELKNHPFFIAAQYHPEFTSRINRPNPLFRGFVEKIIENSN